jgi:hypothetical protein
MCQYYPCIANSSYFFIVAAMPFLLTITRILQQHFQLQKEKLLQFFLSTTGWIYIRKRLKLHPHVTRDPNEEDKMTKPIPAIEELNPLLS